MKGFDNLHIKPAVRGLNELDISRDHETSMDIGQICVLFNEELVPRDEIPVNGDYFARVAPLVKPTYGRCLFKTVSVFVPYHQVAEDADAFFAGKSSWLGSTPHLRYFQAIELHNLFTPAYGYVTSVGASATNFDRVFVSSSGVVTYYLFTNVGRYVYKILNQLGYQIPENVDLQSNTWWTTIGQFRKFSAFPLLAFFKAYNDWMSQSQRYNTSQLSNYLLNIRQDKQMTNLYINGHILVACLNVMFQQVLLNYDNDYFTSAWQNPISPINSSDSITSITVPGNSNVISHDVSTYRDVVAPLPVSNNVASLSARTLQFLHSFDDWVRRNNYTGSRDVQQIFSRFGIKTDDYRTHFAHVLGVTEDIMNVGDVTATAETTGVDLGDYAGKGIVSCKSYSECKSSDYGLFMIIGYVTVKPQMPFGFDRKVLRNDPLDWYNPEFDGTGADAISYREVFESCKIDPSTDVTTNGDSVFGFTEKYNAYRFGRDQVTGDFKVFKDMDVWHFARDLSALRPTANMVAQSSSFNTMPQSGSEYNRIFSITSDSVDHFYFVCRFGVKALRPMKNLNQVPELGEGELEVSRNGNVIN